MATRLFATKSYEILMKEMAGEHRLRRVLGPVALTSLGVGAIIGTGIFVLTGVAAHDKTGPALMLSFVFSGVACIFAALCYAEFASMVPVAGSAYTYAYATMGELFAWIIGWDLILEYAVASSTVAHGWSHYFQALLDQFNIHLPLVVTNAPFDYNPATGHLAMTGTWFDLPAIVIAAIITCVLVIGIKESAGFNAFMVIVKLAIVFFVIAVAAVITGMVPYNQINIDAPVSDAFRQAGLPWARFLISIGALTGITSVLLVMMLSQPRVFLAMARDGLLPTGFFGAVHDRFRTPWKATILTGIFVATLAALVPLRILADLVNIGTLLAFVMVCSAVLIMRRTNPDAPRPFRAPFVPATPILGIALCLLLMFSLPSENWERLFGWLAIGFVIYFFYGRHHSVLAKTLAAEIKRHGVSPAGALVAEPPRPDPRR